MANKNESPEWWLALTAPATFWGAGSMVDYAVTGDLFAVRLAITEGRVWP